MSLCEPLTILRARQYPLTSASYSLRVDVLLFFIRTDFEGLVTLVVFILFILPFILLGVFFGGFQLRF